MLKVKRKIKREKILLQNQLQKRKAKIKRDKHQQLEKLDLTQEVKIQTIQSN